MTAYEPDAPLAGVSVLLLTSGSGSGLVCGTAAAELGAAECLVLTAGRTEHTPAPVIAATDVEPSLGPDNGAGSMVWAGLQRSAADVLVIVDTDRGGVPTVSDLQALAGACSDDVQVVLGVNPLPATEPLVENLVRPALALHHPHLAHLAAPLASVWAVRRDNLEMLPIPVGEGAVLAAVLDTDNLFGPDAIGEVSLASWQSAPADTPADEPVAALRSAVQVLTVLERRLPQRMPVSEDPVALPGTDEHARVDECPPAAALPGYLSDLRQRRASGTR